MPGTAIADVLSLFTPDLSLARAELELAKHFGAAGIDEPHRDAKRLIGGILGLDGAALIANNDVPIGKAAERIADAARRRLKREPVSRILGVRSFYGRDFLVTPDVLDPRPDTETVVDLTLELIRQRGIAGHPLSIADIGTGSGVLIATLLAELPKARGFATDISPAALQVARANAGRLGVADRVTFYAGSILAGCPNALDVVVSNPPYIPKADLAHLEPDVRDFDPHIALDGGDDGFAIYRSIGSALADLSRSTLLVTEAGAGQASDIVRIFERAGAVFVSQRMDLGGHVRAVALEIHLKSDP